MKSMRYSLVLVVVLIGAAIAKLHLPKEELELESYQKVSAAEFAAMRREAPHLVTEDPTVGAGRFEAQYFEFTCRSEPALLVDNSSSQLLIVSFAIRASGTPCTQPLRSRWSSRFIPDKLSFPADLHIRDLLTAQTRLQIQLAVRLHVRLSR